MENEPVTVYRSTQIFRKFLYDYRDQLSASVIVAGYDDKEGGQVKILFLLYYSSLTSFTSLNRCSYKDRIIDSQCQ